MNYTLKTFTQILLLILVISYNYLVYATSISAPLVIQVKQPSGHTFTIHSKGIAGQHWYEIADGYTVIKDKNTWYYAKKAANGLLIKSSHIIGPNSSNLLPKTFSKHIKPNKKDYNQKKTTLTSQLKTKLPETDGELQFDIQSDPQYGVSGYSKAQNLLKVQGITNQNLIVVEVSFTDSTIINSGAVSTSGTIGDGFFGSGKSVKDYYSKNFDGQFIIVPGTESQGTANDGVISISLASAHPNFGDNFTTAKVTVSDVYDAIDTYIDFAIYDSNSDGNISPSELSIILVIAGYENSYGGAVAATPRVWAHKSSLSTAKNFDGKTISQYTLGGEMHGYASSPENDHRFTIGVLAHELGHLMFGLPDLYDTNGGTNSTGDTYKIWLDKYKLGEYFHLENRQAFNYDEALPSEGLIITHIDPTKTSNADETNKWVDIEEADGLSHLDIESNPGDGGDPFPGTSSNTDFNATSNPNTLMYDSTNTGLAISAITEGGDDIDFTVQIGSIGAGDNVSYVSGNQTSYGLGYDNSIAWSAVRFTNDTSLDLLEGFEIYIREAGTVEIYLYQSLVSNTPTTELYHEVTPVAVTQGWNRILMQTAQAFTPASDIVLVLKITTGGYGFPMSLEQGTDSGRSFMNSSGPGGSYLAVSTTYGEANQRLLIGEGDTDSDGILNVNDNCPAVSNADQLNTDGDSEGNACDIDDDNDAMPDVWENANGLDSLVDDAALDGDNDGLNNLGEYTNSTDPANPDSDGDTMLDGYEVTNSYDPLDSTDCPASLCTIAGLPFTEDFSASNLNDDSQTSAKWSTEEQAVYLAWRSQAHHGLADSSTAGISIDTDVNSSEAVILGDVDNDGDLDLISANTGATNKLYLNDGSGGFPATGIDIGSETDFTLAAILGDIDNDGDLDLIVGNGAQNNRLYLNTGSNYVAGNGFSATGTELDTGNNDYTVSISLGDVNNNGYLDLITGNNTNQPNRLYLNDGNGGFPSSGTIIGSNIDRAASMQFGDVNNDGSLDLVVGYGGGWPGFTNRLYLNDGSGGFANSATSGIAIGSELDHTYSIQLGDVDSDGDLDIVAVNSGVTNKLYLNSGNGVFPDGSTSGIAIGTETESTRSSILADIDSDGDLDLIVGHTAGNTVQYLNNGSGVFSTSGIVLGSETSESKAFAAADLDRDGDIDLIVAKSGSNILYLNHVDLTQAGKTFGSAADDTNATAFGDVNGDGHLDMIEGNKGNTNKLFINDGTGNYPASGTVIGTEVHNTWSVELGDIDGDGDLDLVTADYGVTNKLYLNDGNGGFSASGIAIGPSNTNSLVVSLGDVDADGDLDLIAANLDEANKIYLNTGSDYAAGNGFTSTGTNISEDINNTYSAALADIDGDGDLDYVTGNVAIPNKVGDGINKTYFNNGSGTFSAIGTDIGTDVGVTRSITLGDVDNDGDLDFIAGNYGSGGPESNNAYKLYLNDGNGSFTLQGITLTSDIVFTSHVTLGDIDSDGDLDLLTGNDNQYARLYYNDGTGTFSSTVDVEIGTSTDYTRSIHMVDVDSDGDLDVVAGIGAKANRVYKNSGIGMLTNTGTDIGTSGGSSRSIALGDVNGDSNIDVVVGNLGANKLYLNDSNGGFTSTGTSIGSESDSTRSVALIDIDSDGDLDLVAGNFGQTNKLYLNNGSGTFSTNGIAIGGTEETIFVTLGDVDTDGDIDLITGNVLANKLYLNTGSDYVAGNGFLAGTTIGSESETTWSVTLGDVDNDGDLDIVSAGEGTTNKLYLNNGSAIFSSTGINIGSDTDNTRIVMLADLNKDGNLDLVSANWVGINKLQLNTGSDYANGNGFSTIGTSIGSETNATDAASLADVDKDGDLDLIVGNYGQVNQVYINNGLGTFSSTVTELGSSAALTSFVALADINNDGDMELVTANMGTKNKLYNYFSYKTHGKTVVSKKINDAETGITNLTLTALETKNTATSRNTDITYYLSNNGGSKWHQVKSGEAFTFPSAGDDVRWKAELHSLSAIISPKISQIIIEEKITIAAALALVIDANLNVCLTTATSGMTNTNELTSLICNSSSISNLTGLGNFTGLTSLQLMFNSISDISELSALTSLTYLLLNGNQISDISSLSNLTSLVTLGFNNNQVSDLSPLSGLSLLEGLTFNDNQIVDISDLSGLTALTMLTLAGNSIVDISGLSGLTALTSLALDYNQIVNISALLNLTLLTNWSITNNPISNASDTDGDGLGDLFELNNGYDVLFVDESADDDDSDGLTNLEEYLANTDPNLSDTDNDGMSDGYEIDEGLDPLDSSDCPSWMCGSSKIWLYKLQTP